MINSNTNLVNALASGANLIEALRVELENTLNTLLQLELTGFLEYEKHDVKGYNSGNSRNGCYQRTLKTQFGEITVEIPRDRNGEFQNKLLKPYQREYGDLETMVIHLYKKGITTREIAELIEKMYGCYYSAQTISNMTSALQAQVDEFHSRPLKGTYTVIYCDATYIPVRRGTVQKEALHILLGITPEGYKEVLDYAIYPSETVLAYESMLEAIKQRGVTHVGLFVTDGFNGLKEACLRVFPNARYQRCWVHLSRNVRMLVRKSDALTVLTSLKAVYKAPTSEAATEELATFLDTWATRYPKLATLLSDITDLFTFLDFPVSIQQSLYTTNIIENFNKHLKRFSKHKEQFSTEGALERFVCMHAIEYNSKFSDRCHKGFKEAQILN